MSALYIAVDPGFDSVKVVANGKIFKFPFVAEETDERKISDYGIRSDFLLYRNNDGTTYRVGQYARELIFDNKNRHNMDSRMNELYSEKRFISAEFQVGLRTAIGLAITENGPVLIEANTIPGFTTAQYSGYGWVTDGYGYQPLFDAVHGIGFEDDGRYEKVVLRLS